MGIRIAPRWPKRLPAGFGPGEHGIAAKTVDFVRPAAVVLLLVSLAASGCDSSSKEPEPPDLGNNPEPVVTAHLVVGTWQTFGTHERLGEVEIVRTLEADGTLRMVVGLPAGEA